MRIGLLGGTFNPVHNGHITLAMEAKLRLKLDKVIFIPAYIPVHKNAVEIANAKDRLSMIEFAIGSSPGLEVSRYEIDKAEKVYSVDTIKHFKDIYPESTEIFFIAGEDALSGLDTWKDIDRIFALSKFVVFSRPGFSRDNTRQEVEIIDMDEVYISSTDIRQRAAKGSPIEAMVPVRVADYISKNNLYKQAR